ncbi:MAG: hypothetical protein C0603_10410 [Denitrovibrio sp.]|nr:MAG: hypothetical protein C0603_10410 [Denitrovibrio sp.]
MNDMKVLVVDDDKLNRMLISKLLGKYGVVSSQAENGYAAIDLAKSEDFDFIFMDYNMPKLSGAECAGMIKEHYAEKNKKAPVLVCISADEGCCSDSVFDKYLLKPFNIEDLKDLLTQTGV